MQTTRDEFAESQLRRLMMSLFLQRARRHLQTLAVTYNWSPDVLALYEERYLQPAAHVPTWTSAQEK
jgi:hypothetical protein